MINIRRGFEEKDRSKAAKLYVIAFKRKFEKLLGEEAILQRMFEKAMNSDFSLCAYEDGNLLGICGFHAGKHGLVEIKGRDFIENFGLIKGLWKAFLTDMIFTRKVKSKKELLMDGIAVDKDNRGQGIGSKLFQALIEYGIEENYNSIRLDVIDENPKAKALYQKLGFKETYYEKVPKYISKLIGVSGVTAMVKEL